jgi:cytochrome c peroxidase
LARTLKQPDGDIGLHLLAFEYREINPRNALALFSLRAVTHRTCRQSAECSNRFALRLVNPLRHAPDNPASIENIAWPKVPLRPFFRAVGSLLVLLVAARGETSSTLAPPTGVVASDGAYATKIAVTWDPVPWAKTYRVYRNLSDDPSSATELGATSSWVFWDATASPGRSYYYWVRAEATGSPSSLSAADSGFRGRATIVGQARPTLEPPTARRGNPITLAKVALGKALFWDEQLSVTNTVSCGTCHLPEKGGVDPRALTGAARSRHPGPDGRLGTADDVTGSPGVPLMDAEGRLVWDELKGFDEQVTKRIGRSSIDAGYSNELSWDGRSSPVFRNPISNAVVLAGGGALESQSLEPLVSSVEMAQNGRTWDEVTTKIAAAVPLALATEVPGGLDRWIGMRSYPQLFEDAFGTPEITPARIAFAIASYERTLFSDRTPFDEANALLRERPIAAARGLNTFKAKTCATCHAGITFSDEQAHHIGVRPRDAPEDGGRSDVSSADADRGTFLTPGLRNVALRGPYMHNGGLASLDAVLQFYDRGGDFRSPFNEIQDFDLSPDERSDLVAFLESLTDPRLPARVYPFDRPTLYSESNRIPVQSGSGVAGTEGVVPRATTIGPPVLGNSHFTFAVHGALGGAAAVLVIGASEPPPDRIPKPGEVIGRFDVTLAGEGAGQGRATFRWTVPSDPTLAGTRYHARWYIHDPGAPGGIATSERIELTLFAPRGTTLP